MRAVVELSVERGKADSQEPGGLFLVRFRLGNDIEDVFSLETVESFS